MKQGSHKILNINGLGGLSIKTGKKTYSNISNSLQLTEPTSVRPLTTSTLSFGPVDCRLGYVHW